MHITQQIILTATFPLHHPHQRLILHKISHFQPFEKFKLSKNFAQGGCIWAKVDEFGQSGCIRAKVVVFGQKLFYSGIKDVFGQGGCIRAKMVLLRQKWIYSGKSGCTRA